MSPDVERVEPNWPTARMAWNRGIVLKDRRGLIVGILSPYVFQERDNLLIFNFAQASYTLSPPNFTSGER